MRLPNADRAIIAPEKLRDYLLNPVHLQNRGKARLFAALGYTRENWQLMESDIRSQILVLDATELLGFPQRRFQIAGVLRGSIGHARIATFGALDQDALAPRFLTAYPRR